MARQDDFRMRNSPFRPCGAALSYHKCFRSLLRTQRCFYCRAQSHLVPGAVFGRRLFLGGSSYRPMPGYAEPCDAHLTPAKPKELGDLCPATRKQKGQLTCEGRNRPCPGGWRPVDRAARGRRRPFFSAAKSHGDTGDQCCQTSERVAAAKGQPEGSRNGCSAGPPDSFREGIGPRRHSYLDFGD